MILVIKELDCFTAFKTRGLVRHLPNNFLRVTLKILSSLYLLNNKPISLCLAIEVA